MSGDSRRCSSSSGYRRSRWDRVPSLDNSTACSEDLKSVWPLMREIGNQLCRSVDVALPINCDSLDAVSPDGFLLCMEAAVVVVVAGHSSDSVVLGVV